MFKYDFTVVIPVYNARRFIKRCINSVLRQKYKDGGVQIVLVDDGSTDDSLDVCQDYAAQHPEISVFHQENQGVSSARNCGMRHAEGKYILFLDSDDYISSRSLERIFEFFEAHYDEIDMVTYPIKHDYGGRIVPHTRYRELYKRGTGVYDLNKYPNHVQVTINVCIKNSESGELKLFDENQHFSEDERFDTELLMEKEKIGYVKGATYFWRRNEHSANANTSQPYYCFESLVAYYEMLFNKYRRNGRVHVYVQNLLLNTLYWRIARGLLLPHHYQGAEFENALARIDNLIKQLDAEQIIKMRKMNAHTKIRLLEIGGERVLPDYINGAFCVKCNGYKLYSRSSVTVDVKYLNVRNGRVRQLLAVYSPLLHFGSVKLEMVKKNIQGGEVAEEMELKPSNLMAARDEYYTVKPWLVDIELDPAQVRSFSFRMRYRNKTIPIVLNLGAVNCTFVKQGVSVHGKDNEIYIRKAGLFDGLRHNIKRNLNARKMDKSLWKIDLYSKLFIRRKKIALYSDRSGAIDNAYYQFKHDIHKKDGINRYYVYWNKKIKETMFTEEEKQYLVKAHSRQHRILYLNADYIFTSFAEKSVYNPYIKKQKAALSFKDYELIYLQHGVLHAKLQNLYSKEIAGIDRIVVSSAMEKRNLVSGYYYRDDDIIESTMPRFSASQNIIKDADRGKRIILALSWRKYLIGDLVNGKHRTLKKSYFLQSNYYKEVEGFLSSQRLADLLEQNDATLVVQMHPNFSGYKNLFSYSDRVVLNDGNIEIFDSDLLITDFSSFQFDFVRLGIPTIYFLPDKDEFAAGLHTYREIEMGVEDRFGPMTFNHEACIHKLEDFCNSGWKQDDFYETKMETFFIKEKDPCGYIYEAIERQEKQK